MTVFLKYEMRINMNVSLNLLILSGVSVRIIDDEEDVLRATSGVVFFSVLPI
jgi:hypothetical protein